LDEVIEQKVLAVSKLESQVFEGGANGSQELVDSLPPASDSAGRLEWIRQRWTQRQANEADTFRPALVRWYGEEAGKAVKYAEVFEICEYGRRPSPDEIRQLFPF
jgi:hypothetical protein